MLALPEYVGSAVRTALGGVFGRWCEIPISHLKHTGDVYLSTRSQTMRCPAVLTSSAVAGLLPSRTKRKSMSRM